jgi:uncharacterized protein YbgA (DUF1722 family)/uncharacterized protein YbbK (DUF523 family)
VPGREHAAARSTPAVGVSSCLLGQPVRYDGGHKKNEFVVSTLAPHVRLVAVCPEVEYGLGTPRETLRLVRAGDDVRMVMKGGEDHTDGMRRFAEARVKALEREDLDGFILKKDSPSCGMERVKVYGATGPGVRNGRGVFADVLIRRCPLLPVEEEGRLSDPRLRENFIERVFAYRRLKTTFAPRWTHGALVAFHTAHKFVVMAHSNEAYRRLGRLVAEGRRRVRNEVRDEYQRGFMQALRLVATPRRHANVLMHMVGFFRPQLDAESRDELLASIDDYRRGLLPLIVPVTLIRHHARRLRVTYLAGQVYLDPHPRELALRNHV